MSFKNIKVAPLVLSASIIAFSGLANASRVHAAQLNLNSSVETVGNEDFAVPFDATLQESGLIEPASQDSDLAGFNCDFSPEGFEEEVQPEGDVLSHLGPNLVAQAGAPFDISQFSGAEQGPIVGEMCELEGAPIGGPGGGFPFAALAPLAGLGALGFLGGGDDAVTPPDVPEPIAIPFVFSALGIGAVAARKRFKSSDSE